MKNQLQKILGFGLEPTGNLDFGDYTANIAMVKAKGANKNPREYAEDLLKKLKSLKQLNSLVDKIDVAGPGFINFWLKTDVLISNLIQISKEKEKYGSSDLNKDKLAIVEYSSPNIAKPFGVGHLRSTVIGDAVANLMEATGYTVMRDNHLGDWGTQFGKMIYAIKTWGDEESIEKSDSPVAELVKLYVKFHDESKVDEKLEDEGRMWFRKLEDGDMEARRLWQKCIDWSWIEFNKVYSMMGIKFSPEFNKGRGLGESFFENRMTLVLDELNKKHLLQTGEGGAKLVFFEEEKYPPLMILKKDGATLYATRDLATDKYRLEKYNPDIVVNEVGSEQGLYFRQLFELEKILGWYKDGQRVHVGHGLYLTDGKKMSTRAGKTVKLDDVFTEATQRAKKLGNEKEDIARAVGIGAIKYFDLSHHPDTNINFDWNSMFALEGNSGPYLQYTVARTNSVLAKITNYKLQITNFDAITMDNQELTVLRLLTRFGEVVEASAFNYSPNILCAYLYDLAQKFNSFYATHRILSTNDSSTSGEAASPNVDKIIGSDNENFRLALTFGVGQVLKNGLNLLGIEAPEKM